MEFTINPEKGPHAVILKLTIEEYQRICVEAEYVSTPPRRCPTLAALIDAKAEFDAVLVGSHGRCAAAPIYGIELPLVRTGQGAYTRDYPAEQLAGARVEAVAELHPGQRCDFVV